MRYSSLSRICPDSRSPKLPVLWSPWVFAAGLSLLWLTQIALPRRTQGIVPFLHSGLRGVQCVREFEATVPPSNRPAFDGHFNVVTYYRHVRPIETPNDLPQWSQFQAWAKQTHPVWIQGSSYLAQVYGVSPEVYSNFIEKDLGYTPHPCRPESGLTIYASPPP